MPVLTHDPSHPPRSLWLLRSWVPSWLVSLFALRAQSYDAIDFVLATLGTKLTRAEADKLIALLNSRVSE